MKFNSIRSAFIKLLPLLLALSMLLSLAGCTSLPKFGDPTGDPSETTKAPGGSGDEPLDAFPELTIIDELFRDKTLFELDDEALLTAVLKGYIEGTGDKYAEYFTEEEYNLLASENRGDLVGVGISVVQNTDRSCAEIINVYPDSPALEAGVLPGDLITYVGIGEDRQAVAEIGFTMALDLLRGEENTYAEFVVERNGTEIEFSIIRKKVTVIAVQHHTYSPEDGKKVGIVEISGFDMTTPTAFENAVDSLVAEGCEYIIFDVRNNPGGDLASITAVLAFFLDEDDVVIRTSDRKGNYTVRKITPVRYGQDYAGCSIDKEDIGKYKDLKTAVLTNENTASAAELFSAALKDHGVSFTVGTLTYGKGTMQTTFLLERYGLKGALKLTTQYYYPPFSDSYEGIGVVPDVEAELSEELADKNIYLIKDEEDDQLAAAIKALDERNK